MSAHSIKCIVYSDQMQTAFIPGYTAASNCLQKIWTQVRCDKRRQAKIAKCTFEKVKC